MQSRVLTKTLGLDIANVELFLHVPLHHLIHHQKTACDRGAACEWLVGVRVRVYSYHSHVVLLAGIVVDDVACLLVAGASYPIFGEVLHACNPILVLSTSFTP